MSRSPSVLIIRFGRLGDVVLTASATRAVRTALPDHRIDYVTHEAYAAVAALLPGVDRVIPAEPGGALASSRATQRGLDPSYELLVDLHGNIRSRALGALTRAGKRVRYRRDSLRRRILVRFKWGAGKGLPVWRRYLSALESAGIPVSAEAPRIEPPDGPPGGVIALAPGAGRETKRWPEERFAEVIREIHSRWRLPMVLIGSTGETQLLERIAAGTPTVPVRVMAGDPIPEVASVLCKCALLITNDSGLLHLSEAVGTPVIAIFGPTTPELGFAPSDKRSVLLTENLECSPCTLHGSDRCPVPERNHQCMRDLTVRAVLAELPRFLDGEGDLRGVQ